MHLDPEDEDELLLEDEVQDDPPEEEINSDVNDEGDDEDGETVIAFEGEEEPVEREQETSLVRQLRARIKQLRREPIVDTGQSAAQPVEVGPRPTLESCEYDEDRLGQELDAWAERKAQVKVQEQAAEREQAKAAEQAKAIEATYKAQAAKLNVPNYDRAEETAIETLGARRMSLLIRSLDNPPALIAALDRYPKRMEALSGVTDEVRFVAAVAKMEKDLKVSTRRKAPEPEGTVRGSASIATGGTDKKLERLEKEADKSGDRTALIAYRKSQRK